MLTTLSLLTTLLLRQSKVKVLKVHLIAINDSEPGTSQKYFYH